MVRAVLPAAIAAALLATTALAADAAAGKARFQGECGLCHSAAPGDGGGGMGPNLAGVVGRPAASADKAYPYSDALRASNLAWDAATLDRFLGGPSTLVPGTNMSAAVPDPAARADLIAYLQSLKPAAPQP